MGDKRPIIVELEQGMLYKWCACGKTKKEPWCDKSHIGSDVKPIVFTAEASGKKAMCVCKQSGNKPFCDGTHKTL